MHSGLSLIASSGPSRHFALQGVLVSNPTIQTLTAEGTEFNFRHVQPTAVLGGVDDFQFAREPVGFFRRKGFV